MKPHPFVIAIVLVVAAGGYGLYALGVSRGKQMGAPGSAAAASGGALKPSDIDPAAGKKVLYWHDPMVPGQRFDKPGKSPFMDMQLVPVYADSAGSEGAVSISPRVQQNLGIRTAEVTRATLKPVIEAVGSVVFNERDVAVVQARTNAFVERLHVRALLDPVRKGQSLAELYAPDWVAAQEEYLTVKRMTGEGVPSLLDGAQQRMRLAGMTEDHIRLIQTTGKVHPRLTVTAPAGGIIAELGVREGSTVMSGAPLFRINGLGTVWINAELPERQAALVRPGALVEVRTQAFPDVVLKGRVNAVLPEVTAPTRTIRVRIEVANPGGRLAAGMFATVSFAPGASTEALFVPTEAVIQTGKRTVVILVQEGGTFRPADVEIGAEANGQTEVRKGLEAGQKVVVSGQFLIDSEASLRASATRMGGSEVSATSKPADGVHRGEAKIESVAKDEVTLSHGPIPSLKWPAMTMAFKLPPDTAPKSLRTGDMVSFEFREAAGGYEITKMEPKK